jgi:Microtubule-associated tyrosine carboxypeptidase
MSVRLTDLDRMFASAERATALLDRCRPLNVLSEQERLHESWHRGERAEPAWIFAAPPDLFRYRAGLEAVAERGAESGPWGALYAARARELALEAAAAECVAQPDFSRRAAARFAVDPGEHGARAEAWARAWAAEAPAPDSERRIASDDERDPESLFSAMRRAVGERRLPFRVLLSADLPSAAATGDGVILVRSKIFLRPLDVERIVVHEVEGHALTRHRARSKQGLYRVGSAQGSDDEEGRALVLEQRSGCFDATRRAELAWRHLAALAVREGANWMHCVDLLLACGASLRSAIDIASRVERGGGLGREIVYLTALSRVQQALELDPELETWMEHGRISAAAARVLRDLGEPPELLRALSAA